MPGCIHCSRIEELCKSLGIPYQYKDCMDPKTRREFIRLFPGEDKVPQIMWEGKHITFSQFKEMIDVKLKNGEI